MARGRAARNAGAAVGPRTMGARARPPGPDRAAGRAGGEPGAELVPIRYGRMLVSPFTFYRGAALIMAADLAATPVSGVTVQLCGDAHLSNFGLFGTPERRMLFDINDFDETLPGPWEWDVKRLAASFEIMGRDRGFSPADRRAVVMAGVAEYRDRMRQAAGMGAWTRGTTTWKPGCCSSWSARRSASSGSARGEAPGGSGHGREGEDPRQHPGVRQASSEIDGELRIVADPPLIIPIEDLVMPGSEWEDPAPLIKKLLASYRRTLGRPAPPDRGVPLRPHGLQDGRRGQRRDPLLHHAAAGPRPQRPAVPADQGGASLGARAVRGQEHLPRTTASEWWRASG